MGASISKKGRGTPMPIMPSENIGIISGAIRKPRRQGKRMSPKGSVRPSPVIGQRPLFRGEHEFAEKLRRDREAGINRTPEEERKLYKEMVSETPAIDASGIAVDPVTGKIVAPSEVMRRRRPRFSKPTVSPPPDSPMQPGFNPRRPSAVQETRRVNVQDPTLGGPPEREVPIPRERRPKITRESDPRGGAPFAPDDSAAKDRFFETMFERAANQKERRAIDKAERRDTQESMREEAMLREREMSDRGRRRRRTRRKDFTRRRPEKRRSREERAAFRDRYVSTLGSNFFS